MHTRRRFVLSSAGLATAMLAPRAPLHAQTQPLLKQATIIVGSPAGGATDKLARMYAEALRSNFATTVIVENRPGAGGIIAYEYVKNSGVDDGSLMFLSPAYPIVISPHVARNLPYDTLRDFVPVGVAGRSMLTFAVGPAVPASVTTLADYVQWVRQDPARTVYAAQNGSSQHLAGSTLSRVLKLPLENVSYKGDAPAMQDVLGGHMPAVVLPIASSIIHHRAGRLRVLAVAGARRSRFLPDVPTLTELGYPEVLFQDWLGVFAPARTSPAVVERINQAMGQVIRSQQGETTLMNLGFEPEAASPKEFAEMVQADYARYRGVVEKANFREVVEKATGR
ncbi:MAG: hypothetical protein J0H09_25225 [Burkholderiales bacterium]|nr:hypothetical protein [Burkholderiales bacterium]